MDWFLWVIVGLWALSGLMAVALIGKPREPIDPGLAVGLVLIYALLIVGLLVTR